MPLTNQVALLTGASRGLGRALALRLAQDGVRLALCARSQEPLQQLAAEIEAKGGQVIIGKVDVTRYDQVETFANQVKAHYGALNILINNAGLGWYKPFLEKSLEEIDLQLDVNLKGVVYTTRACLPAMLEAGGGQIVNVASDLSRRPLAQMPTYAAAKHGVLGFGHSILREFHRQSIKVMTLTPGIIDTYFGGAEAGSREEPGALRSEAVADVVAFMLNQPRYVVLDEVAIHPLHQDF